MPDERQQIRVVTTHGGKRDVRLRVRHLHDARVIVEASELCVEVLLDERRVSCRRVDLAIGIADQVEGDAPEG